MVQKECKLHFILTGAELYYAYYLAIVSALKTQAVSEIVLWCFETPKGDYWQFLDDRVRCELLDRCDFPALKGKPDIFRYAHEKDYLQWKVLYEHGGVFMDLDTFCVHDVSGMLDESCEIVAALDFSSVDDNPYPFLNCIVMAQRGSSVIKAVLDEAYKLLQKKEMKWGDTGIPIFSVILMEHLDVVKQIESGVLAGHGEKVWGSDSTYKEGKLWHKSKVIHLYGGHFPKHLLQIDPMYIKSNLSLYSDLVKQTLFEREWNPYAYQSS